MGAQWVSQSRGQLVSHNKRPPGVSTSTQWVEARYHSGGRSFSARERIVRPGSSTSHVRSQLMAPQLRILTVVPDAVICSFLLSDTCNGSFASSCSAGGAGGRGLPRLSLWCDGPHLVERD